MFVSKPYDSKRDIADMIRKIWRGKEQACNHGFVNKGHTIGKNGYCWVCGDSVESINSKRKGSVSISVVPVPVEFSDCCMDCVMDLKAKRKPECALAHIADGIFCKQIGG